MNKFEIDDMDWLKRILNGQADNLGCLMLSHGRTERIINHIEELERKLHDENDPFWKDKYRHQVAHTDKQEGRILELESQMAEISELPEKWRNRMEPYYLVDNDFLHGRKDANHTCASELQAIINREKA